MGLFSTKKKHVVNTTVSRLIEDDYIPNSAKTGVINSLISNDEQLVENIVENLVHCISVKAHRMRNYGAKHYTYGLPSGGAVSSNYGKSVIEEGIKALYGPDTALLYYEFGPLNNLHDGWEKLVSQYGYKSSTNQLEVLTLQKNAPVFLKDMVVVLTTASFEELGFNGLEQWGTPPNSGVTPDRVIGYGVHSNYQVDPNALEDYVLVTYQWKVGTSILEDSLEIPFTTSLDTDDYFQLKYSVDGNDGYFTYKEGAGEYPELDNLFTTGTLPHGSYFPFAYFRYNKTSMGADVNSPGYKTSEKLLDYLNINYADMIESIHENPDIADVEQAMLMMAIPADSSDQMDLRYLFDFFKEAGEYFDDGYVNNVYTVPNLQMFPLDPLDKPPKRSWIIEDDRFKLVIGCDAVYRRKRAGSVAPVGEYAKEYKEVVYTYTYIDRESLDEEGNPTLQTGTMSLPTYFYRYQLTADVYEEIEVVNIRSFYHVWGTLTSVGDETDPTLLIPLDYEITKNYNIPDREKLYARSLHLVFNSHQIIKIKWYQTGIFKVIMVVVAVVIAWYTGQFQLVATAIAAGGTAVLTLIFQMVLQYIIVTVALKLFIKLVGVKIAFLIAIIAFAAGVGMSIDAGSIAGAPWASELLSISSNLTSGIGDYIQAGMEALAKDAAAFANYAAEQTKLLDTANELLENSTVLSPWVIFGESPNDFYNRTVHSGNIGIVGIDAISNFVEVSLKLPKLTDTMEYT